MVSLFSAFSACSADNFSVPAKRLLLFDIDGTLVNTGGAGVESHKTTVRHQYGTDDDLREAAEKIAAYVGTLPATSTVTPIRTAG